MRILCMSYEYPPLGGGGGAVACGLAEELVRRGHRVDIVTSGMRPLATEEVINGVRIFRVPCLRRYRHYTTAAELLTQVWPAYLQGLRLARTHAYDLNHTHFIVPSGIAAHLLWRKTGLPYVLTAHGSDVPGYNPDRFKGLHRVIRRPWHRITDHSCALTAPSRFLAGMLQRRQVGRPVTVIPNGFGRNIQPAGPKEDLILIVTRLFERKGVQFFLQAVADFKTDWRIIVAGDGPYLPRLKQMAASLTPRIEFVGFVRGGELERLYQRAKIFVFPSIQENFPVVLMEAMAAGCAVITTSAFGCAEVIGDAGIQTLPGNAAALRQALGPLMRDDAAIARLGAQAQERARAFTWPAVAGRYEDLFRDVLAGSSGEPWPPGREARDGWR